MFIYISLVRKQGQWFVRCCRNTVATYAYKFMKNGGHEHQHHVTKFDNFSTRHGQSVYLDGKTAVAQNYGKLRTQRLLDSMTTSARWQVSLMRRPPEWKEPVYSLPSIKTCSGGILYAKGSLGSYSTTTFNELSQRSRCVL